MAKFLSPEWFDRLHALGGVQPERPGASGVLQVAVSGGPDGGVGWYAVVVDGRLHECALGDHAEPDATLALSYDDAVAVQQGVLDPNVAFMQGRMKVNGDMGPVLSLLPLTRAAEYDTLRRELESVTEF